MAAATTTIRLSITSGKLVTPERDAPLAEWPNAVHTARFTPLTWLPKSLYLQFHRVANVYFFAVAVFACTPLWGKKWQSKITMLVLVLSVQAIKDLIEDLKRRRDDNRENTRGTRRFQDGAFAIITWEECDVGDIILVRKGESFPCDILVAASSEGSGAFYASTKSLDGETNLKERQASPHIREWLSGKCDSKELANPEELAGCLQRGFGVQVDIPDVSLEQLNCLIECERGNVHGVDIHNFGLRGCELQNTQWIVGVACYVGSNTKVRMNSSPPPSKISELELFLNRCVLCILAAILCFSAYFTVASELRGDASRLSLYEVCVKYLIVLYPVLPMTLYVSFEVMHVIIGNQIEADKLMCDRETNTFANARNTSIVEELGQVDFVFSDKTGTLTANEMRFAYCCVGPEIVGPFLEDASGQTKHGIPEARQMLESRGAYSGARAFFESLAVCHTLKMDEDGSYQGESPDEVALVQAAADVGVRLIAREVADKGIIHRVASDWGIADHSIAHVLGFTSDRKRMSVVCPRCDDAGGAIVITKGADSVMEKLLSSAGLPAAAKSALDLFSKQGLRTLVIARRELSATEYAAWKEQWEAANAALEDKVQAVERAAEAIESDLTYVGVTALEDRLQEAVPETIATMRAASIHVWVLTGDKVETAVEIAKSCRLFEPAMKIFTIVGMTSSLQACNELERAVDEARLEIDSCGIVLDGTSVSYILQDAEARATLYKLGACCSSCVCCRLSPRQKRQLVELVREQNPNAITLSIGDGANDVPMIQGAHVGVGIRGKEGSAAIQACDMAISQFSFVGNLLFCHGRKAYRRIATLLLYFIYKSVTLGWSYILYAHTVGFSGRLAYPEWLDMSYNMLTTGAVVVVMAYDFDVTDEVALARPLLYLDGPDRKYLNLRVFTKWMFSATLHGVLAWSIPIYVHTTFSERRDQTDTYWCVSYTAFATTIITVHAKLLLSSWERITRIGIFVISCELLAFVAVSVLLGTPEPLGEQLSPELLGVPLAVVTSFKYMSCVFFVPCFVFSVDMVYNVARARINHSVDRVVSRVRRISSDSQSASLTDTVELSTQPFVCPFARGIDARNV